MPAPALTGVLGGLLFVAAPQVTRYAQEARAYGLVTMCATIATYLLLRALADGRWRWWAAYGQRSSRPGCSTCWRCCCWPHMGDRVGRAHQAGAARAHGECAPAAPVMPSAMPVSRWLAAAGAATVVLSPLLVTGWQQRRQISWLARPGLRAVSNLVISFAGSNPLVPLMACWWRPG